MTKDPSHFSLSLTSIFTLLPQLIFLAISLFISLSIYLSIYLYLSLFFFFARPQLPTPIMLFVLLSLLICFSLAVSFYLSHIHAFFLCSSACLPGSVTHHIIDDHPICGTVRLFSLPLILKPNKLKKTRLSLSC